jgi:hypothetical protein
VRDARAVEPPTDSAEEQGSPASPVNNNFVRYERNLLTVNVAGMPLYAFLVEVGRQSGAQISMDGVGGRTVSGSFTRLPLDEGLRRLLANENFTLIYAQERTADGQVIGTRLKGLQVYGSGGPVTTASTSQPTATESVVAAVEKPPDVKGSVMEQVSHFLQKYENIPLPEGSALAQTLGAEQASAATLITTAMREDDPDLRTEAAQILAGVFDADPEARELGSSQRAAGMDLDAIAAVVRASGGDHSEEFLQEMASRLKTPALRLRTNQILARLRRLQ